MRLYLKLAILILIAVAIQKRTAVCKNLDEVWFGVRCDLAYKINDQQMIDRMVVEAAQRTHAEWAECAARVNAAGGS